VTRGMWVHLPYATFGIEVNDCNIVTDAAPIARWMIGKHINAVAAWVERKEGVMRWLTNTS
jgi:hypothetical protein